MDLKIAALKKEQLSMYRPFLLEQAAERIQENEVHVLGALADGKLAGVLAFAEGDPARVLSIAVSEAYQRKGIGSALMDDLARRLIDAKADGVEAYLFGTDEEEYIDLADFLDYCGFTEQESYPLVKVTLGEVAAHKEFARMEGEKTSMKTRLISELSQMEKKNLGKMLSDKAGYHGFPRAGLVEKVSCIYEDKGETIGCVLMGEKKDTLVLQFVFLRNDFSDRTALFRMMQRTLEASRAAYGDEKRLRILAMHETSEKIVEYFFDGVGEAELLNRFYLPFRMERESILPVYKAEENTEMRKKEADEDKIEERKVIGGAMSVDQEFHLLDINDLVCKDCIYRMPDMGVGMCHKYNIKPDDVLEGEPCKKYRKEKEG